MRSSVVTLAAIVLLAAFVGGGLVAGAPAAKDKPTPPPTDHVEGPLETRLGSPVVLVRPAAAGDPDAEVVYWLVWTDPAKEAAQLAGVAPGDRVTARGKIGAGGRYRYLVVSAIEKD